MSSAYTEPKKMFGEINLGAFDTRATTDIHHKYLNK